MPKIEVLRGPRIPSSYDLTDPLKLQLRKSCARELTVPEHPLTVDDFSFRFPERGVDDEMSADLEIFIPAHNFPNRVDRCDNIAEAIAADTVTLMQENYLTCGTVLKVAVSLLLIPLGYKSLTTRKMQPTRRYTDAYDIGHGTAGP